MKKVAMWMRTHLAARAETDGHGHEVLFLRCNIWPNAWGTSEETFGVGGILRVTIHRDDLLVDLAHTDERAP
ncbi:MAG: hypothetical protein U1F83_11255 [Verrucomicrobiota bacterium]